MENKEAINTVLFAAAQKGGLSKLKQAIADGANVNVANDNWTVLMCTAEFGKADCMKFLLDNDADINCQDNDNETALIAAAFHGHIECVKLLLEYGADVSIKDYHGNTALDRAKSRQNDDIVSLIEGNYQKSFVEQKNLQEVIVSNSSNLVNKIIF